MNPLPMHPPQPSAAPPDPDEGPSLADLFAPPKPGAPAAETASLAPGGVEDPEMRARVQRVLDELRPYINADGGDISLVSVADGVVRVAMHGACAGCSSSLYTLQLGVERRLREEIPGVKYVEAI